MSSVSFNFWLKASSFDLKDSFNEFNSLFNLFCCFSASSTFLAKFSFSFFKTSLVFSTAFFASSAIVFNFLFLIAETTPNVVAAARITSVTTVVVEILVFESLCLFLLFSVLLRSFKLTFAGVSPMKPMLFIFI